MAGFDYEFELQVLAGAIADSRYRNRVKRIVRRADPWTTQALRELWELVSSLGDRDTLTAGLVKRFVDDITDDDEAAEVLEAAREVFEVVPTATGYAARKLETWVRKHSLVAGTAALIDKLSADDVEGSEELIRALARDPFALQNGVDGGDWFEGFDERQSQRLEEKEDPALRPVIRTRLPTLDSKLNGGLRLEEFGLIVGFTNVGKSFFALNFAFVGAASDFVVCYVSTEMSKLLVDTRLDARFFKRETADFYAHAFSKRDLAEFEDRRARLRSRIEKRLYTYAVPVNSLTKAGLEEILDDVEEDAGAPVQLLVMDSADHMLPSARIREKRLQQSAVYWDLKAIVGERKLACWTTTHAGGSFKPLLTEFDQAESKEKGKIASKIITLNQTRAEQRADLLRVYIAKNRGGEKGEVVWVATDYARGSIAETDPPDDEEDDDE